MFALIFPLAPLPDDAVDSGGAALVQEALSNPSAVQQGGPGNPDIEVLYIERTPRLAFDEWDLTYSSGQYSPGDTVTFVAHVKNWGPAAQDVEYVWTLNDAQQASGSVNVGPGAIAEVEFDWTWEEARNFVGFQADPDDKLSEFSKLNNEVEIATNALRVGLWVEQTVFDHHHAHQWEMGDGENSFYGWGQRMIDRWNFMFRMASLWYDDRDMIDRVALDKVVVVADNELPLAWGRDTNNPDANDKTVDMMWGYPYEEDHLDMDGSNDWWEVRKSGPFYLDYGSIHEMNHARFHIDLYGFDIHGSRPDWNDYPRIKVTDDQGDLIVGTDYMPFIAWEAVYYNKWRGIMGSASVFGAYDAMVWNWKATLRGRGNMNSPRDIGDFLEDLPQENVFRFVDQNGEPIANAELKIYQASGNSGHWYGKTFEDSVDFTFTTDANGAVTLPQNPFGSPILHTHGIANTVTLMNLETGGEDYYFFQEITDFNLAYNAGYTDTAFYTRQIDLPSAPSVPSNAYRGNYFGDENLDSRVTSRTDGALDFTWSGSPASGVPADGFSAYWLGDIRLHEGWKTLKVETDGGVAVRRNGKTLLDEWDNDGLTTFEVDFYAYDADNKVWPGNTSKQREDRIEILYRHGSGEARLKVDFDEYQPDENYPLNAFRSDLYKTGNLSGYLTSRLEEKVEQDYSELNSPDPLLWGGGDWGIRWTGNWEFVPSRYQFHLDLGGRGRLKVDGAPVINQYGGFYTGDYFHEQPMDGVHRVVVEYGKGTSNPHVGLTWSQVLRSMTGAIDFGLTNATDPDEVTFEFRRPGQTEAYQTVTTSIGDAGAFTATGAPSAVADVSLKPEGFLRKTFNVDLDQGNVNGLNLELVNGDINGDNRIGSADYLALVNAYNSSSGSSNWNAAADLNNDGKVGSADFLILVQNYGQQGDE